MGNPRRCGLVPVLVLAWAGTALAQGQGGRDRADSGPEWPSGRPFGMRMAEEGDDLSFSPTCGQCLCERLLGPFSTAKDPDGPINTDRPTFTPANTVVPNGRLQIESGYTFTHDLTATTRRNAHNFPELSVRVGLSERVELRTYWLGPTYSRSQGRIDGTTSNRNGVSDMEVGFKIQLLRGEKERPWLPTTALITSVIAPTGGSSPYSGQSVQPNVNLLYGWSVTDALTIAGSTGYLGIRQQNPAAPTDSFERFNQSIVAFYSATEKTTLFYEWYTFLYTNAADNRPVHSMDGGLLYRPTPNTQFDVRAGFGLGDRPDDFFTGAGYSIRF